MKYLEIFKQIIKEEAEALQNFSQTNDKNIEQAIDLIFKTKGKIVISGIGKSGLIGQKIASTFTSTGTTAIFLHPAEAGHGDMGILQKEDLLILISNNGEQNEFEYLYNRCNNLNIPIIAITGNDKSTLYHNAKIPILLNIKKEVSIYPFIPSISSTLTLAIGDGLALSVAKLKNFKTEDFAKLHPSGTLGKLLTKKVEQLMHMGNQIPFLKENTSMKDILYIVSSFRLGIGIVIDNDKRLMGVITDGDIRRTFEKHGKNGFDLLAKDIMTKTPIAISPNIVAKEALDTMEEKKITVLPVVNENNIVVGILHMHDILGGEK